MTVQACSLQWAAHQKRGWCLPAVLPMAQSKGRPDWSTMGEMKNCAVSACIHHFCSWETWLQKCSHRHQRTHKITKREAHTHAFPPEGLSSFQDSTGESWRVWGVLKWCRWCIFFCMKCFSICVLCMILASQHKCNNSLDVLHLCVFYSL